MKARAGGCRSEKLAGVRAWSPTNVMPDESAEKHKSSPSRLVTPRTDHLLHDVDLSRQIDFLN